LTAEGVSKSVSGGGCTPARVGRLPGSRDPRTAGRSIQPVEWLGALWRVPINMARRPPRGSVNCRTRDGALSIVLGHQILRGQGHVSKVRVSAGANPQPEETIRVAELEVGDPERRPTRIVDK